jgi:hypothetical protein
LMHARPIGFPCPAAFATASVPLVLRFTQLGGPRPRWSPGGAVRRCAADAASTRIGGGWTVDRSGARMIAESHKRRSARGRWAEIVFTQGDLAMAEMIAFCGLDCHQCGAFLATRDDNDAQRREVAAIWSREHGSDLRAQDIDCEGCVSEGGVLFSHCDVCEIRRCGRERGIANCAFCSDYPCTRLSEFLSLVPESKTRLDSMRGGI